MALDIALYKKKIIIIIIIIIIKWQLVTCIFRFPTNNSVEYEEGLFVNAYWSKRALL